MKFLNRDDERRRLDRLARGRTGGLAVIYGRRRIGKSRLLLEWSRSHDGLYTVADTSAPDVQRRYLAKAAAERFAGFADVAYSDWGTLLSRLAREARLANWRGPLIFDELPYLVGSSPELPSVLQRWLDTEAREANLVVAIAGSSQRMMQGLVLSGDAPLYGRAREIMALGPLEVRYLRSIFRPKSSADLLEIHTAWGGVPRYWELAEAERGPPKNRVERIVLDPLGPLHREPDRLLLEESPSALEVRPVLDAIGSGAHRVSEIAGRIGRPATSMARPLERLVSMGLVRREIPFGESEKKSRRSLYKMEDPFFRLWFRVVAPYRGQLASGTRATRRRLLDKYWPALAAAAWEDLCRFRLPQLKRASRVGRLGPWGPASRWWKGAAPKWDVVALALNQERVLLGEVKWATRVLSVTAARRLTSAVAGKDAPALPSPLSQYPVVRVLFVPDAHEDVPTRMNGVYLVRGIDVIG